MKPKGVFISINREPR